MHKQQDANKHQFLTQNQFIHWTDANVKASTMDHYHSCLLKRPESQTHLANQEKVFSKLKIITFIDLLK